MFLLSFAMDLLEEAGKWGIIDEVVGMAGRKRGGMSGARAIKKVKKGISDYLVKEEDGGAGASSSSAAANAPEPVSATPTKSEDDSDGSGIPSSAGQVQDIRINRPVIMKSSPGTVTKRFYKKNQFYINALDNFNSEKTAVKSYGLAHTKWHCMPWRHSGFYINDREWRNLQGISKAYRYKKCGFKMSNVTCHTGLLTGTGTPSVQLGYNGVLCMSNILSMNDIGPSTVVNESGDVLAGATVKEMISNPYRTKGYKKFPFHLDTTTQVNQLDYTGIDQFTTLQLPNIMDRMYTKIGSFPHTEWGTVIPDRWRSSFGSVTPGSMLWNTNEEWNQDEVKFKNGYGDSMGYRELGGSMTNRIARLYGCHSRNVSLNPWINNDNIYPVENRQQSIYGNSNFQNIDDLTLIKNDPQQFVFGFTLPVPEGTNEPNVYIAFELETEIEVEYVPLTFDSDGDYISNTILPVQPDSSAAIEFNANVPPLKKWDAVCNISVLPSNRFLATTDFDLLDVPVTINPNDKLTSKTGQGANFRDGEFRAWNPNNIAIINPIPTLEAHIEHNQYYHG